MTDSENKDNPPEEWPRHDSEDDKIDISYSEVRRIKAKEENNQLNIERLLWAFVPILFGAIYILISQEADMRTEFRELEDDRPLMLAVISAVFLFPVLFRLIFGALPLESIRRKRAQRQLESKFSENTQSSSEMGAAEIRIMTDSLSIDELSASSATKLFSYYASSSRQLSQSIYGRAGAYLLVGIIVAFSGLVFFYSQTAQLKFDGDDDFAILSELVPKFGILFFIELVAFFFLRQHRSTMDEFRYYEAIKRNREETLALIRIAADNGTPIDPIDLVKNDSFFSKSGVIAKDQTTEILESRKLEKNELDLLEKVIDIVSRSKK